MFILNGKQDAIVNIKTNAVIGVNGQTVYYYPPTSNTEERIPLGTYSSNLKAQAALMYLVNSLEEKGKLYRMTVDCMID